MLSEIKCPNCNSELLENIAEKTKLLPNVSVEVFSCKECPTVFKVKRKLYIIPITNF